MVEEDAEGFSFAMGTYRWSLIACVKAKYDLCIYRQSPTKLIFPWVIQRKVQSHSCHPYIVISTVGMAERSNLSGPSVAFAPLHNYFCLVKRKAAIRTASAHVAILRGARPVCLNCSVRRRSLVKQKHRGQTLKVKISVRRRLS